MNNISQLDWARLAAYIDGEGCIFIHRQKQYSQKAKSNWKPHYIVQVTVTNTDPRLIVWLRGNFGGFIVSQEKSGKCRTYFKWTAHSKACADILTNCLPYFIIKRKQAEIAIAFRATYNRKYIGRGKSVPDAVIAKRDGMVAELKAERNSVPEMIQ